MAAIEKGLFEREITAKSTEDLRRVESKEKIVVGVNEYVVEEPLAIEIRTIEPEEEKRQIEKVNQLRKRRDNEAVKGALAELKAAAQGKVNLVEPLVKVVKAYATIGEICEALATVWGRYEATRA